MITSRPPTATTTSFALIWASLEELRDRVGDDGGIHHFALDDGIVGDAGEGHLFEHRLTRGVIDHHDLDVAAADVEPDGGARTGEERHRSPDCAVEGSRNVPWPSPDGPTEVRPSNPLLHK